jgi:hypothetical protein
MATYSDDEFAADTVGEAAIGGAREGARGEAASAGSPEDESAPERGEEADEALRKLRMANGALRQQLRDFGRALEASLGGGSAGGEGGCAGGMESDKESKKSLRALVASRQRQVSALQKKLDGYRKSNAQLKRQLQAAYTSDRVLVMSNENKEKQAEIERLTQENRNLVQMQRAQAKRILQQEGSKEEWPMRLANLQDELRVTRETLRKYKEKARVAEDEGNRHREQCAVLGERNRELKAQLEARQAAAGSAEAEAAAQQAAAEGAAVASEERAKLVHNIEVLQTAHRQERQRAAQAARRAEDALKEHQREVDELRRRIEEKEKDLRYQVVQIKKLKRGLRELASGDISDAQWSLNMARFLDGSAAHDEEDKCSAAANSSADRNNNNVNSSNSSSADRSNPRSPVKQQQQQQQHPEQEPEVAAEQDMFAKLSGEEQELDGAGLPPARPSGKKRTEGPRDEKIAKGNDSPRSPKAETLKAPAASPKALAPKPVSPKPAQLPKPHEQVPPAIDQAPDSVGNEALPDEAAPAAKKSAFAKPSFGSKKKKPALTS